MSTFIFFTLLQGRDTPNLGSAALVGQSAEDFRLIPHVESPLAVGQREITLIG